jgi:hypothetical protein
MTPREHHRALAHFEERTRELGLTVTRSDLVVLFRGWVSLQSQLARARRCLVSQALHMTNDEKSRDEHC